MGAGSGKKRALEVWISLATDFSDAEFDELFWFTKARKGYENGVNTYIMTMLSRNPRQIVAFDVDISVRSQVIQQMSDSVPPFARNHTDGGTAYLEVVFGGKHCRNTRDKSQTHLIEGSNADLRHYIAGLRRKSRCFFRKLSTLKAVLWVFINAYNKFGEAKRLYRERHPECGRDFAFSHLDYI